MAVIKAEINEAMDSRASLDVNQDGEVSAREYGLSQPSTGRVVDEDGLDGHARGYFEREDYDRNGVIMLGEIARGRAKIGHDNCGTAAEPVQFASGC